MLLLVWRLDWRLLLVLIGLLAVGWGFPRAHAQPLPLVSSQVDPYTNYRLTQLEDAAQRTAADRRLSVLENRLDNIEKVGTGILIAVAAQLILSGVQLRFRSRQDAADNRRTDDNTIREYLDRSRAARHRDYTADEDDGA